METGAMKLSICGRVALLVSFIAIVAHPVRAEEFYHNKTIRILIGTEVGGSYGIYAQLVSRHLGKFIPGNPSLTVVSMPGAGGLVALNYMATVAPRDGTVASVPLVTMAQEYLFDPAAKFDPRSFRFIGRVSDLSFLGVASRKSGITSISDAKKREVIAGSPGLSNVPGQAPLILNKIAGTRFRLISGYGGTGPAFLALDRGEVEVVVTSLDSVRVLHKDALKSGAIVPIFAQSIKRLPGFPDVPTILELANNQTEKQFLNIFSATAEIGRSLMTTPGVPNDRVQELRNAFERMLIDGEFKTDAAALGISIEPRTGDYLDKFVASTIDLNAKQRSAAKAFYDDIMPNIH
jgi:tripartite-type tricarboxylate transporter receptor subunit TctC